ncbi:hypothetical protein HHI36_016942 [Cryptolaemus montrouzieri]|uniref:Uncharacterized protein n=1 Tax=Cryptolaemus montrouzieri TaxID=559131 RepID=A0ABD2NM63_9CUCU
MANQMDWEKKYQEDLERAQALSLESLALEQFRQNKLLEERTKSISKACKSVSVNRAFSMSETDSGTSFERNQNKSRPRPGGTFTSQGSSLLAPPPSSQRKNSCSSSNDMPDLISFSSPPSRSANILDFANISQ